MKCPACMNQLTELWIGSVRVDVCEGGCGGIWFDAFEMQRVDEEHEPAGEHLLHIKRNPAIHVDHSRKRDCPRCDGIKLKRHFFSAQRNVEVDHCPNCGGNWLDAGELGKIRLERTQTAKAEQVRQSSVSSEMIRYLYRLKTEQKP